MSFFSTRGGACVTASQAILYGLAPDGGLYVPSMFPRISREKLAALAGMSYCERASEILRRYLEDFSISEIDDALTAAYGGGKFDDAAVAPLKELDERTHVLELFHGPTLAFKDMALQLLPHLTTLSARKNGEKREIGILVATSGDTGKAALEGFKDVPGTSCTVFYPLDGVSDVQKLQMVTTGGANTHVIAVEGNFDDAQTGVKRLFSSAEFEERVHATGRVLSSANSINFGRLVPQVVYYFSAYADLLKTRKIVMGEPVNFVVPTGNFGNILAAFYAKNMGIPVGKLICASNENKVLYDFFDTGIYDRNREFVLTSSPSMDILISSNLERLIYRIAGEDAAKTKEMMDALSADGKYTLTEEMKAQLADFVGGWASEEKTAAEIKRVYDATGYVMDTHTAVASAVYKEYKDRTGDETKTVIASTASPYKFATSVMTAIDAKYEGMDDFALIDELSKVSGVSIPQAVEEIRSAPVLHDTVCETADMQKTVETILGL